MTSKLDLVKARLADAEFLGFDTPAHKSGAAKLLGPKTVNAKVGSPKAPMSVAAKVGGPKVGARSVSAKIGTAPKIRKAASA